ncbi:MAG: hypothetical protein LCH30_01365 [Proteobacteria bacterium]|nr:hypothetical protein [Pseudomonadota bacterium]
MISFLKRAQLKKEFFSCPPNPNDLFYAGNTPVNCQANSFSIQSLSTLNQLLEQKIETVFRFLVDTEGKLWFAFETRPNNNAPKHFQMTGDPIEMASCLTAGNLKFKNKKGTHLKNISHRSGDFYPSFLSLRWLLAILLINKELLPFKLPRVIIVKEIRGEKVYKHVWRVKRAQKWLDSFRHNERLMSQLDQRALNSKTVHYESIKYPAEATS